MLSLRSDAATIAFATERPIASAFVEALSKRGNVKSGTAGGRSFRVELEGLRPDTRYEYRVVTDGYETLGAFGTPPRGMGSFTFLVYGDNRGASPAHASIVSAMAGERADFALHTGDATERGEDPRDWEHFFSVERDLLRNLPLFPAIGNHDSIGFERAFGLKRRYSFDYSNARFLVLDGGDHSDAQTEWLRAELERAARESVVHVFLLLHQPLYSPGPHGDNPELIARWSTLLARRDVRVRALFAGHDHLYARLHALGRTHFVTGGAGAPLYPVRRGRSEANVLCAESVHHYLRVRVRGSHADVTAIRLDGSVIERVSL